MARLEVAGGRARVTGLANGETVLSATTAQGVFTATIRVGVPVLETGVLDRLADWLSPIAAAGGLAPDPVTPQRLADAPAALESAVTNALGEPARLAAFTLDPAVFQRDPVSITAADLSLAGSAAARAAVDDPALASAIADLLVKLELAGVPVGPLQQAFLHTQFHEEGAAAGGIHPRRGVPAVTFTPEPGGGTSWTWYNGGLVRVYDGTIHTVFAQATATAVRQGAMTDGPRLTEAGSTVLHELAHAALHDAGQDALDDEGLIGDVEALLRARADLGLSEQAGSPDPGALERLYRNTRDLASKPGGPPLLDFFGLTIAPAAAAITAPAEVVIGQTFTVRLTLAGAAPRPGELVLLKVQGDAANPGSSVVRTGAGGEVEVTITAGAAEGVITLQTLFVSDQRTADVAVVDPANPSAYLTLAHPIEADGFAYRVGQVLFLHQIEGGQVTPAHEPNCPHIHLHGTLYIDEFGPFADPNPTGCGFGPVSHSSP